MFEIGGGTVRRGFRCGDRYRKSGEPLSRAEIMAIPAVNRRVLIEKQYILVYPVSPLAPHGTDASGFPLQRVAVKDESGDYHVLEGRRINEEPLTKKQAVDLATNPIHSREIASH